MHYLIRTNTTLYILKDIFNLLICLIQLSNNDYHQDMYPLRWVLKTFVFMRQLLLDLGVLYWCTSRTVIVGELLFNKIN